jgi:DNA-binding SARP family transcriptional activator
MLEIRLFGSGELMYDGKKLVGFPNRVPYLLLCYLFLNRRHSYNREHLAAVFWSDYTIANSRKMLRNALWRLRQGFTTIGVPQEDYFQFDEDSIFLLPSSAFVLDVETFESAVADLQDVPGQSLTVEQAAGLEAAAALYVGDLLEGIYTDWCLYDRERLRLTYLEVLSKLMVHAGANGCYEQGIHYGIRLLAMDATWEKVHRQLMWLYWLSGDRASAFAQYKLCLQILREELAAGPTPDTQQLYELMLHDRFDPRAWLKNENQPARAAKASPEGPSQTVNLLQQELHRLKDMIEAARVKSDLIESLINDALNM